MAVKRRIGSTDSQNREKLLESAAYLLRTEGYSAVTVRRLAANAGLKRQIVHYYFRSMEELFLAVVRRSSEAYIAHQQEIMGSDNPLRSAWELVANPVGAKLEIEYLALANHFESIRNLLAEFRIRSRELQIEAVAALLEKREFQISVEDPSAIMVLLRGLARGIAMEANVGITRGHAEATDAIELALQPFDNDASNK